MLADSLSMVRVNLLLLLIITSLADAEVWNCKNGVYSTKQGEDCELVASSVYCGNGGNKYISPLKNVDDLVVETCEETNEWKSPIVDLELAKTMPKRTEKKLQSSLSTKKKGASSDNPLADNAIVDQYKAIFDSYNKILEP